jgi:hypothetical protein
MAGPTCIETAEIFELNLLSAVSASLGLIMP